MLKNTERMFRYLYSSTPGTHLCQIVSFSNCQILVSWRCPCGHELLVNHMSLPYYTQSRPSSQDLPWWPSSLRRSHWLLSVSHHWGPALMDEQSKAQPLTAPCLSPLRTCPDGRAVYIRRSHWLLPVSHYCLGLNPGLGLWESCQWVGVRWWFSPGTAVSSTTYNWLVTY